MTLGTNAGMLRAHSTRTPILGFPWPQTGARIPISWKKGFRGPNTPISPRSGKGSFLSKHPLFFCKGTRRKWGFLDRKLPFPAFVRARGNGGFWTPKPSFPGNGDSGCCLGSGESQPQIHPFGVRLQFLSELSRSCSQVSIIQPWFSACAPLCCKNMCCASPFCTGGGGAAGSRSKQCPRARKAKC